MCKSCFSKLWNSRNKEKRKEWYRKNRETQLEKGRERYIRNKEQKLQYSKQYRKQNKDRARDNQLKRLYGITLQEYNQLLLQQNNCCGLCGIEPIKVPVVDHDHTSLKVRGIICQGCNIIVGFFEARPEAFARITNYLNKDSK